MRLPFKRTLLAFACLCVASSDQTVCLSVLKLLDSATLLVLAGWELFEANSAIPLDHSMHWRENMILDKLRTLDEHVESLNVQIRDAIDTAVATIVDALTKVIKTEIRINDLNQYSATIQTAYRDFVKIAKDKGDFEQNTLENFAWAVVSHETHSVMKTLDKVHEFIVPLGSVVGHYSLPKMLSKVTGELDAPTVCDLEQSQQQMLLNFYNNLAILEIKGYVMVQFSYMLLRLHGRGTFKKEFETYRELFRERTSSTMAAIKPEIEKSSRQLARCNPKRHVEGETYIQITQLLQGYIENEIDLSPKGLCGASCADFKNAKVNSCYQDLFCDKQRKCNGRVRDCTFVHPHMRVCPSSDANRRYDYVKYDNGQVYGTQIGQCKRDELRVESWWRWKLWHCSYCLCLCDDDGAHSDRYVSLNEATSNVEKNRVITGLRFVKKGRVVHLQVQEGELLEDGVIGKNTTRWVPVSEADNSFAMTYEDRAVNLDDVTINPGHVLTGVKFSKYGSRLYLRVRMTPFRFATGKLRDPLTTSTWKDNLNLNDERPEILLERPDVPTKTVAPATIFSTSKETVRFTNTDFEKDAGQTTVPFFDAQPVVSVPPVPLGGAGVYYKGHKDFGGFVAPKIVTYDFSRHMMEVVVDDDFDAVDNVTESYFKKYSSSKTIR